jgi:hypothetical protein
LQGELPGKRRQRDGLRPYVGKAWIPSCLSLATSLSGYREGGLQIREPMHANRLVRQSVVDFETDRRIVGFSEIEIVHSMPGV